MTRFGPFDERQMVARERELWNEEEMAPARLSPPEARPTGGNPVDGTERIDASGLDLEAEQERIDGLESWLRNYCAARGIDYDAIPATDIGEVVS